MFVCVDGKTFLTSRRNMGALPLRSISVRVLAGLMQSLCTQVINGREPCSQRWRTEAGEFGREKWEQWRDFQ